jgi:hypothetical protein
MFSTPTIAALTGAALFFVPLCGVAAAQPVDDDQVRMCVKHIAEMERNVARRTKGNERREIIALLREAKKACIQGRIASAYSGASKSMQMANKAAK